MSDRDRPRAEGMSQSMRGDDRATVVWAIAVMLAVAATVVLVLSDDSRLLRLGLAAALWAALIGGFSVTRLRRRIAQDEERAAERHRTYERELEREIHARREFELEAESEARRRVVAESTGEIQALKTEVRALRDTLEHVLGGDMLFERVALRAESTRVRSVPEQGGRMPQSQWQGQLPAVPSPGSMPQTGTTQTSGADAAKTQLLSRPSGEPPGRQANRARSARAEAQPPWPERNDGTGRRAAPWQVPDVISQERGRRVQESPGASWHKQGNIEPPPVRDGPAASQAGAHAEGTSVTELLAAYGGSTDTQRRRRRRV